MEDFKVDMLAGGFALAEGPLYDSGRDTLYAVDINAPGFYQYDFRTGEERRFPTPSHCTAVVQTDDEKLLLVALAQELVLFDKDGLTFTPYRKVELGEGMRFNDGAVGPDGALYIGTMMIDGPRSQVGRLIRIDREGERVMEGFTFTVPNGIAFTKDYFYHIDSPADTLRRFHIEGDRLVEEKSAPSPSSTSTGQRWSDTSTRARSAPRPWASSPTAGSPSRQGVPTTAMDSSCSPARMTVLPAASSTGSRGWDDHTSHFCAAGACFLLTLPPLFP